MILSRLSYRFAWLASLSLLLGCRPFPLEQAVVTRTPITQADLVAHASTDESAIESGEQHNEPPPDEQKLNQSAGDIVVLTGKLNEQSFRLWFLWPPGVQPGKPIKITPLSSAQLLVGEPPRFASSHLELNLFIQEDGKHAYVRGKATEAEIFQGSRSLRFEGPVIVQMLEKAPDVELQLAPREFLPQEKSVIRVLPVTSHNLLTQPEGYELQSTPRYALIIPGALLFSFMYLNGAFIHSASDPSYAGAYFIPLAGPSIHFVRYLQRAEEPAWGALAYGLLGAFNLGLTLGQLGGMSMVTIGFTHPKREWVLKQEHGTARTQVSLSLEPLLTHSTQGGGLRLRF